MNIAWIKRRWFDFRLGHGVYLIFAMSFANFVLIFYRLLIEQVDVLAEIFSNLTIFIVGFLLLYIPVAVIVGWWHRKTQMKVEQEQSMRQNPMLARYFRNLLDVIDGKASKEDIEEFRKLLRSIETGKKIKE